MTRRVLGEHFNRDGRPKRAYPDYLTAYMLGQEYGLTAYECTFCGKWHLASPEPVEPPQRKRRRRRRS